MNNLKATYLLLLLTPVSDKIVLQLYRVQVCLKLDKRSAIARLFVTKPLTGMGLTNLSLTHPPVEERIKRLQVLAGMPAR